MRNSLHCKTGKARYFKVASKKKVYYKHNFGTHLTVHQHVRTTQYKQKAGLKIKAYFEL